MISLGTEQELYPVGRLARLGIIFSQCVVQNPNAFNMRPDSRAATVIHFSSVHCVNLVVS
jgi:hypothetical protein